MFGESTLLYIANDYFKKISQVTAIDVEAKNQPEILSIFSSLVRVHLFTVNLQSFSTHIILLLKVCNKQ